MRRSMAIAAVALVAAGAVAGVSWLIGRSDTPSVKRSSAASALAATPPMGFDDWNAFGCRVSASLIEQAALALHDNGMQASGYEYVIIDDCWMDGRDPGEVPAGQTRASVGRGTDGRLVPDPTYFPPSAPGRTDGIARVADFVHGLGLKLGLYADLGTATCQGLAGSYGHETVDAQTFAGWGVDYVKYDDCHLPPGFVRTPAGFRAAYHVMSAALAATGRPIVFSICEHTRAGQSWRWGATQASLWRTTSDLAPTFASLRRNFAANASLSRFAGPGHWNDPDMLQVGTGARSRLAAAASPGDTLLRVAGDPRVVVGAALTVGSAAVGDLESDTVASVRRTGASASEIALATPLRGPHPRGEPIASSGLTETESQTEMSLWAEEAAPLIAGTDVVDLARQNLAIYTNRAVIAVDQDPLGRPARIVAHRGDHWVLVRRLADGDSAVVLFNASNAAWMHARATLGALGLDRSHYRVTNLWTGATTNVSQAVSAAVIPAHGSELLRLSA